MNKIKQYKKQIFTFITIFLLLEFGVYPCLTMADTFANIVGAIALLLLVLWGGFSLYDYVKNSEGLVDKKELSEAEKEWKEHVQRQMEKMNEINSQSVEPKPKRKYTKKTK
jgi:cobalamin biosynthesis protein CobD/CbiB